MKAQLKNIMTLALVAIALSLNAQTFNLSGVVTDKVSGETLIGATISNGVDGTTSDIDGSYIIKLKEGFHSLTFSYVGYQTENINVNITSDQTLNMSLGPSAILNEVVVTADIAIERETPVAFSNIPTIKIEEELAAQDIPMLLNSTPGAYATESGGGDGDARISIRGFDQRNIAVMLDGIPVNDMENGRVFWSNWFGLDLVTQTMQVQRGLGASKLSIPSVGGTINILTQGIDAKKGLKVRQEFGVNGYLRTTLGMTTGRMDSGWGVSLAGSYKQGDGWVDGNFTKGYFYYLRVDKQLGDHLISFSGFGAPQEHGQRPFSAEIGQVDTELARKLNVPESAIEPLEYKNRGRRFNDAWGLRNGEIFNVRKNFYHKPQLSLRHSWQASDKLFLSNVAYLSIGDGGGTAPDGDSFEEDESTGQLNIDARIIDNQTPRFTNPNLYSSTIIRAGKNNHFWYGLLSTLKYDISESLTFSAGLDGRSYEGEHYREVYDLLGGQGFREGLQVGDKFDYWYTGKVDQIGTFGLLEYKFDKWASFLNISVANTKYGYLDNETGFVLDDENVQTGTLKLGATYNINDRNGVFINTGWLSRAQQYRNVIITNFWAPGTDAQLANTFKNEDIKAVELGYNFKSPKFSANVNAYYTVWGNKPLDRLPTIAEDADDPEGNRIPVNIPGIDALHKGIEIDFAFKPNKQISIEGLTSIGDWKWVSGETVNGVLPNGVPYEYEFDANGVHVGDAAQLQFGGLVRYEPIKGAYLKIKTTYFGNNYSEFQPETLQGDNGGRDSWKLPSYMLSSFHMGYSFKFNDNIPLKLRFNILNLFDAVYLSDARNNDNFNSPSFEDFDAKSASVFFGQGRRWSISVQANF